MLDIVQLPAFDDNYIHLLRDVASGALAAVDPGDEAPVIAYCREREWRLTHILNTHHHHDHTGGNLDLKRIYGCTVVGSATDAARIPGLDIGLDDGALFRLGTRECRVIALPGHTRGHIGFHFAADGALFCGDTLFSLGCGRLFEGSAAEMWTSLCALRALPPETRVYCAHEYTAGNARFAATIDGDNPDLARRIAEVTARRAQGLPTVPFLLGEDAAANPFLRADQPALQARLGLAGADPVDVFAEIRRRKDGFR